FEVEGDLAKVYIDLAEWYQLAVRGDEERLAKAQDPQVRLHLQEGVEKRNALLEKAVPLYEHVLEQSAENPYALAGLAEAYLLIGGQDMKGVEYGMRYVRLSEESQANWQAQLKSFEIERK